MRPVSHLEGVSAMGAAVRGRFSSLAGEPLEPTVLLEVLILAALKELPLTGAEREDLFSALATTRETRKTKEPRP